MSYRTALAAAGANVLAFGNFGDWQGSWVALVDYQGERGWVQGAFGSCDHCDAFQAEFGWLDDENSDYQQRLADFGRGYLNGLQTLDQVLATFASSAEWDSDSESAMHYIRTVHDLHHTQPR